MQLVVDRQGQVETIHSELIDLGSIGDLKIRRASHVEPTSGLRALAVRWLEGFQVYTDQFDDSAWWADILDEVSDQTLVVLGPFQTKTEALAAEVRWLEARQVSMQ